MGYQYFFDYSWIPWSQKHRSGHQDCRPITKNVEVRGFQRYFTLFDTTTHPITGFHGKIIGYQYFYDHISLPWPQKHRYRHNDCLSITKNRGVMGFQRFGWRPFCFWLVKYFPRGCQGGTRLILVPDMSEDQNQQ